MLGLSTAFKSLSSLSAASVARARASLMTRGRAFHSVFGFGPTVTAGLPACISRNMDNSHIGGLNGGPQMLTQTRMMNRNARRPKRANHGKRPVSHARKREKMKSLKSRLYREKVFGFW